MRYLGDGAVPEGHARSALAKSDVLGGAAEDAVTVSDWLQVTREGAVRFCGLPKLDTMRDGDEYGLHLKKCTRTPINMDACERLAASLENTGVVAQWRDMMRFLTDATLYAHVPCDWSAPPATMTKRHTERLIRLSNVECTQRSEVRNVMRRFLHPEHDKRRYRLISHPAAINEALPRAVGTTALADINVTNVTRRQAWTDVVTSPGAIEFDFASYFEMFEMHENVRPFFCFATDHGWFRNRRMPTGATFSSAVATSTTRLLLSGLEHPEVKIRHNIDNVRMAGPRQHVLELATRFVERCNAVGVVINDMADDDTRTVREQLEAMYVTMNDFHGDVADYTRKTLQARPRQIERLREWTRRVLDGPASYRDYFSAYCTAMHVAEVQGIPRTSHLEVHNFYRACARQLAVHPALWDRTMHRIAPKSAIKQYLERCSRNAPGKVSLMEHPKGVVFVDASAVGWGCVQVIHGQVLKSEGHQWPTDTTAQSSVVSEPLALQMATKHIHPEITLHGYVLVTDHLPIAEAFRKGASPNAGYSQCVRALTQEIALKDVRYIEGKKNCADGLSRGSSLDTRDIESAKSHAQRIVESYEGADKALRIVGGGAGARIFRRTPNVHV